MMSLIGDVLIVNWSVGDGTPKLATGVHHKPGEIMKITKSEKKS